MKLAGPSFGGFGEEFRRKKPVSSAKNALFRPQTSVARFASASSGEACDQRRRA
jgi:hypothetical protein